jgi:hypothetical protein
MTMVGHFELWISSRIFNGFHGVIRNQKKDDALKKNWSQKSTTLVVVLQLVSNDTGGILSAAKIFANFWKKSKWDRESHQGPGGDGGRLFGEKTESQKSRDIVPLIEYLNLLYHRRFFESGSLKTARGFLQWVQGKGYSELVSNKKHYFLFLRNKAANKFENH